MVGGSTEKLAWLLEMREVGGRWVVGQDLGGSLEDRRGCRVLTRGFLPAKSLCSTGGSWCCAIVNPPAVIIYVPSAPARGISYGRSFSNAFVSGHLITGCKNELFRNTDRRMQNMQRAISAANEKGSCGSNNRKNAAAPEQT